MLRLGPRALSTVALDRWRPKTKNYRADFARPARISEDGIKPEMPGAWPEPPLFAGPGHFPQKTDAAKLIQSPPCLGDADGFNRPAYPRGGALSCNNRPYPIRGPGCPFCDISGSRLIEAKKLVMAIRDQYPVMERHTPVILRRQRVIDIGLVPTEAVAMHWRFPRSLAVLTAAIFFCLTAITTAARAETAVDLELILAVDVSGSMDEEEHILQRQGYVAAFRHPEVIDTIMSGFIGRVAVTYVEWAGPVSQVVTVPWRIIDGKDSAGAFADVLADEPVALIRGTSISGGLEFAAGLFADNGIEGTRRVIDVSGDGANNMGKPVEAARDRALARGIVINGLPLLLKPRLYLWTDGTGLDGYYRDCVIGGPGSFVIPVTKKTDLARAIRRKLLLEIAGPRARLYHADAPALRAKADCFIGEKIRRSRDDE